MAGIDFAQVRRMVSLRDVLCLLGWKEVEVQKDGTLRGPCPVHGAGPRSRTFCARPHPPAWHCWGCKASGSAIDLYAQVKRLTIYEAAKEICERTGRSVPFILAPAPLASPAPHKPPEQEEEPVSSVAGPPPAVGPGSARL